MVIISHQKHKDIYKSIRKPPSSVIVTSAKWDANLSKRLEKLVYNLHAGPTGASEVLGIARS